MIVIGLVGRIGAGKSTVARHFAEHGATVLDADRFAHEVLADPETAAAVAARFGAQPLAADGRIDRAALARMVFGDTPAHAANLEALEAIVHPRVRRRMEEALAVIRSGESAGNGEAMVVLDVPLLLQAGWGDLCSHLLVVACEESMRQRRLTLRGWSADAAVARDRAWERGFQPPTPGATTWSVDTSGDPAYTLEQVDRVWRAIRGH